LSLIRVVLLALVCVGVFSAPRRAEAQRSLALLELEGDFASPVTTPAVNRFLPGGGGSIGVLFAPFPFLLPSLRLRGIVLGDGPAPQDPTLVDPGVGALYTITAGFRLRTDGFGQSVPEPEATGFWIELNIGAGLTGALARPTFEAALGYLWNAGEGHLDVGPVLRFTHVLQTEERGIDGNSTFLIELGLDVVLFDADPLPVTGERVIETRQAAHERAIEGTDTDGDTIDDADDACPREAEDLDGTRDYDGCPDLDDDGDGIPDTADACPREAEDVDQFEDADGCPDRDNDGDSWGDDVDTCPNEPETENGFEDTDGCPDAVVYVPGAAA